VLGVGGKENLLELLLGLPTEASEAGRLPPLSSTHSRNWGCSQLIGNGPPRGIEGKSKTCGGTGRHSAWPMIKSENPKILGECGSGAKDGKPGIEQKKKSAGRERRVVIYRRV